MLVQLQRGTTALGTERRLRRKPVCQSLAGPAQTVSVQGPAQGGQRRLSYAEEARLGRRTAGQAQNRHRGPDRGSGKARPPRARTSAANTSPIDFVTLRDEQLPAGPELSPTDAGAGFGHDSVSNRCKLL
uniref:(northern house mosquito) hypothetical protein n=1 Tax=Culex pipiens TaxID=7175 RepID=A0A8D8PK70_CULPI